MRTRVGVVLCAISLLAFAQTALPLPFAPLSAAHAQQLPSPATQELFIAVDRNDLAGVRAAIDKGADIEARDFTGTQAVDMAIDRGYFEIARYLISVRNALQDKQAAELPTLPLFSEPGEVGAPQETIPAPEEAAPEPPLDELAEAPVAQPADPTPPKDLPNPFEIVETPPPAPGMLDTVERPDAPDATATPKSPPEPAPEATPEPVQAAEPAPMPVAEPSVENELDAFADLPEPTSPPAEIDLPPAPDMIEADVIEAPAPPAAPQPPMDLEPETPAPVAPQPEEEDNILSILEEKDEARSNANLKLQPKVMEATPDAVVASQPVAKPAPIAEAESSLDLKIDQKAPAETVPDSGTKAVGEVEPDRPSAAKTFITTFLDFFKPPNVTGVVRHEDDRKATIDSVSEEELARQLEEIASVQGDNIIKGPQVPISPEELARELPPSPVLDPLPDGELASAPVDTPALPEYSVRSPSSPSPALPLPDGEDAFGDLAIEDSTEDDQSFSGAPASIIPPKPDYKEAPGVPGKRYDPTKPFGGGVDPEILAYLNLDPRTGITAEEQQVLDEDAGIVAENKTAPSAESDDPFAELEGTPEATQDDNPFDVLEGAEETNVSDLLEGLDTPEEVAALDPKSPPSRAPASDDPFASLGPSDGGDVDELAGLLETSNEDVIGTKGWDVTKVEGADLPSEVIVLSDIEPTEQVLDGVELSLGSGTKLGQEVGKDRLDLMKLDTIHKPCLSRGEAETLFCIDKVSWPFELEEEFLVDTIMYQGTRAIARYDAGKASNFHTLFRTEAFNKVVNYYIQAYGQPSQIVARAIAPLAAPRQENPTYIWQSSEPGTDTISTLEVRKFDDAQGGGFPDTKRGVILLYRAHSKPIFPYLSQLELMVLKEAGSQNANNEPSAGGEPTSIW